MAPRAYIHVENAISFIGIFLLYVYLDYSLLLFFLLLFVPDLSMLGYMWNQKIGSIIYNFGHNLILPIALVIIAFLLEMPILLMVMLTWCAHIFLDRTLGFGLKYSEGFQITHLQKLD